MKTIYFIFLSGILSLPLFAQNKPEVTNVVVSQQTNGSALVDIYYDVTDADGQTMTISVEASNDNGKTWTFPIQTISGDVGLGIQSGTGKHIVWNFAPDHPDMTVQNVQIKVFANDNTSGGFLTYNGFTYTTVKIGFQEWTVENLRTTTYNDGTAITKITDNMTWTTTNRGAYCAWNNNEKAESDYGYLYNWYVFVSGKMSPATGGWRVPTDDDWTKLTDFVGGESISGAKLKTTYDWAGGSGNGTDDFGFSALPGGCRGPGDANFRNVNTFGYWWSSSRKGLDDAYWYRAMGYNGIGVFRNTFGHGTGLSIRLVRDLGGTNTPPTEPTNPSPATGAIDQPTSVTLSWTCSDPEWDRLAYDVYFGTSETPTTLVSPDQSETSLKRSDLSIGTRYYWKVVAKDRKGGEAESPVWSFQTQSSTIVYGTLFYNGFTYKTVKIGTQEWTVENLRTTQYNDGTPITKITTDNNSWTTTTSGAYCAFENIETNKDTYGYLYNWYAVDTKKLAPEGWRVPTDADWTKLTDFVGGASTAGTKLKAKSGWKDNGNGTDDHGFSALPGGDRSDYNGTFRDLGDRGYWWSSTAIGIFAWYRSMFYNYASVSRSNIEHSHGFSVRLVRDL